MMPRLLSTLLILWSSFALLPAAAVAAAKPNIIIVMPDDIGYGDFGCNGNPIIRTPNIDKFASQAVRFTDFHVSPTCAPTRAAILTGRHEFKSGVTHTIYERERLSLKAVTFPQMLKRAGYVNGIFGKWHLGDEPAYQPDKRGFDEVFIHGGGGIGQTYMGSCGDAPGNTYFSPVILHNGKFERTNGYCTDVFFDQAIQWIDAKRKESKPFFAFITPNAAHSPLQVPERYFERYKGTVPDDVAKFYGMIENIDDNFGKLIRQLDRWKITDDTLVIFMTDNGGTLGVKIHNGGLRGGKNSPYQGGTRVPLLVRTPTGFSAGHGDVHTFTAHVDIFPTLATVVGVELTDAEKGQIEGRSFIYPRPQGYYHSVRAPKSSGLEGPSDRYFITHCGRWPRGEAEKAKYHQCSIRGQSYSLVNNVELYDLKNDPGETRNVIDDHPEVVATLRAEYDKWWAEVLPRLENEDAIGPDVNPFKAKYWTQFGGQPDETLKAKMKFDLTKQR